MGISNDIAPRRTQRRVIIPNTDFVDEEEFSESKLTKKEEIDLQPELEEQSIEETSSLDEEKGEDPKKIETSKKTEKADQALADNFFPQSNTIKSSKKVPTKKRNPLWILWALFFILLFILGMQNFGNIKKLLIKEKTPAVAENTLTADTKEEIYTSEKVPDETGTENAPQTQITTTPETTTTQTTEAVNKTVPTETNKGAIKISVLNGNGISNSADAIKKILENNGFTIQKTGNAKKFTYQQTYIYYKTDKEAEANLVKTALTTRSVVLELSDSVVGTYDIVVVVGKN